MLHDRMTEWKTAFPEILAGQDGALDRKKAVLTWPVSAADMEAAADAV